MSCFQTFSVAFAGFLFKTCFVTIPALNCIILRLLQELCLSMVSFEMDGGFELGNCWIDRYLACFDSLENLGIMLMIAKMFDLSWKNILIILTSRFEEKAEVSLCWCRYVVEMICQGSQGVMWSSHTFELNKCWQIDLALSVNLNGMFLLRLVFLSCFGCLYNAAAYTYLQH